MDETNGEPWELWDGTTQKQTEDYENVYRAKLANNNREIAGAKFGQNSIFNSGAMSAATDEASGRGRENVSTPKERSLAPGFEVPACLPACWAVRLLLRSTKLPTVTRPQGQSVSESVLRKHSLRHLAETVHRHTSVLQKSRFATRLKRARSGRW